MKKSILTLCVVVGLLQASYVRDSAKEVVVDTSTSLMWQDSEDANTTKRAWRDAIDYCETLTLGGYDDWRLPNFNELYMIADRTKSNPAISGEFNYVASDWYWTSTTYKNSTDDAWIVYFYHGGFGSAYVKDSTNYVRCVRDGQ